MSTVSLINIIEMMTKLIKTFSSSIVEHPNQFKNGSYECNILNLKLQQYNTKHDDTYNYYEFKVSLLKHLPVDKPN